MKVRVKDVGPPTAVAGLTAAFAAGDMTKIEASWTAPTGFLENGVEVPFPNAAFHVSKYQVRHRWDPEADWSTTAEVTGTSTTLTGLDKSGYRVQVRAVNSEGESDWTTVSVGVQENRKPVLGARSDSREVQYTFPSGPPGVIAFEGEPATDADGDPLTYRLAVGLPDHRVVSAEEGLLRMAKKGNDFHVTGLSGTTPDPSTGPSTGTGRRGRASRWPSTPATGRRNRNHSSSTSGSSTTRRPTSPPRRNPGPRTGTGWRSRWKFTKAPSPPLRRPWDGPR